MNNYEPSNKYILAIETAVSGGSISLLEKGKEIEFWEGNGNVSKSEDVLVAISGLLNKKKIEKNQVEQIVVSRGPGSFTGIRIGLAIGLGLQKSLGCKIGGVSVLEALAFQVEGNGQIITAIPVGSKQFYFQKFEIGHEKKTIKLDLPKIMPIESFNRVLSGELKASFILHKKLYNHILDNFRNEFDFEKRVKCREENLSYLLARNFNDANASDNVKPIYVQNTFTDTERIFQ